MVMITFFWNLTNFQVYDNSLYAKNCDKIRKGIESSSIAKELKQASNLIWSSKRW